MADNDRSREAAQVQPSQFCLAHLQARDSGRSISANAAAPRHRSHIGEREGKPVYWSQAALRRAHEPMVKSRSSDLLILARLALEAAIRTEADLLALFP